MSAVPCTREDCPFRDESPFAYLPHVISLRYFVCEKCKARFERNEDDGTWHRDTEA